MVTAMGTNGWRRRVVIVAAFGSIGLAGCSSSSPSSSEPNDQAAKPSGEVPSNTQKVYLATALACDLTQIDPDAAKENADVAFTPLGVKGNGFRTEVEPFDPCREQKVFNTYGYDVPIPSTGTVTVAPGNQPPAE